MAFDGTNKKMKAEQRYAGRIFLSFFLNPVSNEQVEFFVVYTGDTVALA